jgi:CBS domain containing-hemolysin-like protein
LDRPSGDDKAHGLGSPFERTRAHKGWRPIEIALGLLAVLALILAHGFFVAGEFALIAADREKIERLAEGGDRRARSALAALRSLSFELSGAQLGITVTSLIVGFLAEPTIGRLIEPGLSALGLPDETALGVSVALALFIATALEMVVAELVPKNLAIAKPVDLGLRISTPMRFINRILKPVILFLNAAANMTVRLFGVKPREELIGVRSLDEIQMLIQSSREHGTLREEEFSLLRRSINFRGKTAADALVPRVDVKAIQQDKTLDDLSELARECGHSRFPVYVEDLDDVAGVAHVLDIYRIPLDKRLTTPVSEITRDALIVPEAASLESVLARIRRARQQLVVVVDEYGGTAGIVTTEDLLEEIVGEIEDEYDPRERELTSPVEGVHVLSGSLHPEEVLEATGLDLPDGDYETLAGFLLTLFDRIPEPGEHVSWSDWEFKVLDVEKNRISRVLVCSPGSEQPERVEEDA